MVCLSSPGVMSLTLRILRFWKIPVLQILIKMFPLHIPPPEVVQTQRIQASLQSQLVRKALWRIQQSLMTHICYQCSCTILVFMLPKFNLIISFPSYACLLTSKVDESKCIFVRVGEFLKVNKLLLQIMVKLPAGDNEMNQILQFDKSEVWDSEHQIWCT